MSKSSSKHRSADDIAAEMSDLLPKIVTAMAAYNRSSQAVELATNINAKNYGEYSTRAIRYKSLVDEYLEALARDHG